MKPATVVTGLGLVTPLGTSAEESWGGFLRGESGIRRIDLFESGRYPSAFGAQVDHGALLRFFTGAEANRHEFSTLLIIAAVFEALEQAGLNAQDHEQTSLVLGSTLGGMPAATRYVLDVKKNGLQRARAGALREMPAQSQAHEICDRWNVRGESLIVSDACTSGTNSLGHAMRLIRSGRAEVVIAGGYDPMTEFSFAGFHSLMAISPDLVRPFDKDRKGLMLGEGSAIFILESEAHAKNRRAHIIARLEGYGESADAYHITRPDPESKGAALALQRALDDAQINPDQVDHINAHGTGTSSNDPMEAGAIRQVFGEKAKSIPVTSNKAASQWAVL